MRASISEHGGCACSLLTDDADWNAEVWAIRPEVLGRLAATIEAFAAAIGDGLVLEALWAGDAPNQVIRVRSEQLIELARTNRLGTRSRYEVADIGAG